MQFDPLDELIADLDRAVAPARDDSPGHFDMATWRADHDALSELVLAVTARPRDPDRVRRVEADPRVQLAMAYLARRTG